MENISIFYWISVMKFLERTRNYMKEKYNRIEESFVIYVDILFFYVTNDEKLSYTFLKLYKITINVYFTWRRNFIQTAL